MKPHPRIRKTIKWGGAAVTVLLVVVWLSSAWWQFGWVHHKGSWMLAQDGRLDVLYRFLGNAPWQSGFIFDRTPFWMQFGVDWFGADDAWHLVIPLWAPTVACLACTGWAWRRDLAANRIARLNLCPKCNYDRAGIAGDAKCPECGASATAP